MFNFDISSFEKHVDPDQLACEPADQDLQYFSLCKYKLITGILQRKWIKIGEESRTVYIKNIKYQGKG